MFYLSASDEIDVFHTCYQSRVPLLLKGPTGCGKSAFVEYMAQQLNRPLVKVSCNEDTNSADLFGRFLIKGGDTIWQDGPVVRAIRKDAILYLDEFAEAREDVIVAIHPLTDHRREVYLDKTSETIKAGNNFMVVASYNPGYQSGIKELKPSTKQRFVSITMEYLKPNKEAELLAQLTEIDSNTANKLAKLADSIRRSDAFDLKETVSTRLLVHAASLIRNGISARRACHLSIAEVLSDDAMIVSALKDIIDITI